MFVSRLSSTSRTRPGRPGSRPATGSAAKVRVPNGQVIYGPQRHGHQILPAELGECGIHPLLHLDGGRSRGHEMGGDLMDSPRRDNIIGTPRIYEERPLGITDAYGDPPMLLILRGHERHRRRWGVRGHGDQAMPGRIEPDQDEALASIVDDRLERLKGGHPQEPE